MKKSQPRKQEDGEIIITLPYAISPVNLRSIDECLQSEDWNTAMELAGAGMTNASGTRTKNSVEARHEMMRIKNLMIDSPTMESEDWKMKMRQTMEALKLLRGGLKDKDNEGNGREEDAAEESRRRRKECARHKITLSNLWITNCGKKADRNWAEEKMKEYKAQNEDELERLGDIITQSTEGKLEDKCRIRLRQEVKELSVYDELPWKGGKKIFSKRNLKRIRFLLGLTYF